MEYNALTAWTGLGAALVAVYALWSESRRSRFSISVDVMLRLEEQFSTKRMYANRQKAARAFESGKIEEAVNEVIEIIDFFEGVGYLVEEQALDKKAAWMYFFSYMHRFWHFAGDYIIQERERDRTLWLAYIDLYKMLSAVESRERRKRKRKFRWDKRFCSGLVRDLDEVDLWQFIKEETTLDVTVD